MASSSVAAVQATNDDASASKLSCVTKGYIHDKFVKFFVRKPVRRSPIINRGYYARWASMRTLLLQFLSLSAKGGYKKQILSLGAGFDTLYFNLQEEGLAPDLFVEVDFLTVTSRKAAIIEKHAELYGQLATDAIICKEKGEILSLHYKLLSGDLRNLAELDDVFKRAELDPRLPTLILAECVLIYMEPEDSCNAVKWAAEKISRGVFLIYEQIHPDDAFGHQMMLNLKSRGCPLLGLKDTPTLEAKLKRFTDLGWQRAEAYDMDFVYNQCLDTNDRRRIERLEIFDEFEEWHIMQEHYCVAYGIKDPTGLYAVFGFASKAVGSPSVGTPFPPGAQNSELDT